MRSDRHRELAGSFSSVADVYERSRPDYPAAAVRWLTGDAQARILDLGAGTGKLTRPLLDAGHDVVAVDPSEPMLEHLATAMPRAEVHVGSAEAIPVADNSVDVVVVAQAFHWFDHEVAIPEISRVLRPGGRLALVWNLRDAAVPWVDELWTMINPDEPRRIELADVAGRSPLAESGLFGAVESATFKHTQKLDQQRLVELVTSRSYVAVQSPEERAPLLDAVRAAYDREATSTGVVLPYITYCFRTHRP
jgi:SAM-dependent methyltransferase